MGTRPAINYSRATFIIALLVLALTVVAVEFPPKAAKGMSITISKGPPEAQPVRPTTRWWI